MVKNSYGTMYKDNYSGEKTESEEEFDRKKGFTLIELMIVIGVIGLLTSIVMPRFTDSTDAAKAAQVHGNLHNIQTAIDMFNAVEGEYPKYGEDIGAGDGGNTFSETFEKYYSKGRMPETPAGGKDISTSKADRERIHKWTENELKGGWLYNESRGKLYARLVEDSYGQGNIWITDDDLNDGSNSFFYEGQTLERNGSWFSKETFDEYTLKTSFGIEKAGRIEVYLGGEDGYQLWIHPQMAKVVLRDEKGKVVSTGKLTGISMGTWSGASEKGIPVEVGVSNTADGKKSLALKINNKTVKFKDNNNVTTDTATYKPVSDEDQSVGVVNIKNRPVEVGDTTITAD